LESPFVSQFGSPSRQGGCADQAPCAGGGWDTLPVNGWRRWLWLGVWFAPGFFPSVELGGWGALSAFVVGAAVGCAWQVLARRDPTDRLAWLAAGGMAGSFAWLIVPLIGGDSVDVTTRPGPALYFLAVVFSVLLTEQVLRRRARGPVTLDMVHANDEPAAGERRP
jgi:hypothetical protein